jgi:AcrR family transcriptional regulator
MSQTATLETSQADVLLARVMDPAEGEDSTTESSLDAALTQFQLVGLRRTTVDDVGRQAGLSRMTIYRRYPNKQALTEAVMLREVRRIIQMVERRVAAQANAEDRMVESFVFGLRLVRTHPLLNRLLMTEPEDILPFLTVSSRPFISVGIAFIAQHVRQAQHDTGGPQPDPEAVAEILARLVHSLVLAPEGGLALDDDSDARDFARMYLAPMALGRPGGLPIPAAVDA